MSTETSDVTTPETPAAPAASEVTLAYGGASGLREEGEAARLALFSNQSRDPVRLDGVVKDPLRLREALSALHEVVRSDFRYKPKDRSAYLAYMRQRKAGAGSNAWSAQREYFAWLLRNDPTAWILLDPIVTVSPDELSFEVFSKDEGTYARLALAHGEMKLQGEVVCGTTNIDFSNALLQGVQRMRSYRETRLSIGQDAVGLETVGADEVLEKRIQVPDSWLRGFLQVQSAATLPSTRFRLAAIDLYNLLRHLRLNADRKGEGRALRVELVPGEAPRLVLEPWEEVLPTHAGLYDGRKAEVVKVWGRRRLALLRRWLPYADTVDVHLLGSGLPSFWVLRGGGFTLTLGMSGFTAANWSQAAVFDLLLPRSAERSEPLDKVAAALEAARVASVKELEKATGLKTPAVLAALQQGCQQGVVMYDIAQDRYRLRPLLGVMPEMTRLQHRNLFERQAHDLLAVEGAVKLETENRIFGEGTELIGKVAVAADKREYRPQLMVTEDGRVRQAECTCAHYRQHKLKEGPCPHLLALRLFHGKLMNERAAARGKAREHVTVETRTYVRRRAREEDVVRISLDRTRLQVQWGLRGQRLRAQTLLFNDVPDARDAYFARVDALETRGFLDASAS
ncbi:MAG: SWIM zinc finger family protein [Alphaproteobacteria bacterium]|nr:SWIM zinc finger family protein [Alphaproteobacteria bacterium]